MSIIEKKNEFITNQKHLEYLHILKKCQENYINGVFKVSKKMYAAIHNSKTTDTILEDANVLSVINKSIVYYTRTAKLQRDAK